MKKLCALLLFLIVGAFCLSSCLSNAEKIEWSNITLGENLPTPQSNMMELITDTSEHLSVYIHNMSENDYLEYKKWCTENGFEIEIESYGNSFYAYNSDGYYLHLFYDKSQDKLHISLDIPLELSQYQIPEYALAAGLPMPESDLGKYHWEETDAFFLYVGNTDIDSYNTYKNAVISAGFDIDTYEGETFYSGSNKDDYYVSIGYEGFNTIKIEFKSPDQKTTPDTNNSTDTSQAPTTSATPSITTPPDTTSTPNTSGISAEFKAAMDSYEAFFDEYVAFMKKYQNSSNPISMLVDYGKFVAEYASMMADMIALESEDLSTEEALYYAEVSGRIFQKLAEIAQ